MAKPIPGERVLVKHIFEGRRCDSWGTVVDIEKDGFYAIFDTAWLISDKLWSYEDVLTKVSAPLPVGAEKQTVQIPRGSRFAFPFMIGSRLHITLDVVVTKDVYSGDTEMVVREHDSRLMEVCKMDRRFFINRIENIHMVQREFVNLYSHGDK